MGEGWAGVTVRIGDSRIHLERHTAYPWIGTDVRQDGWSGYARGYAYADDSLMDSVELAKGVARCCADGTVQDFVSKLNGSFVLVASNGTDVVACVDRIRSMPLYYMRSASGVAVWDSPCPDRAMMGRPEVARASVVDILRCGYCIGSRTLYRGVEQLQAGQFLTFEPGRGTSVAFYYQHLHTSNGNVTDDADRIWDISCRAFQRLTDQLNGRVCVVPLSGGYDSRYVVCMLKQLGYERVVCYTYGAARSAEIEPARETAQRLGYDWHIVGYDGRTWDDFVRSPATLDFMMQVAGSASIPHVQEYPAILELHQRNLIPPESVFVPGFCGDVLGGSYVPLDFEDEGSRRLRLGCIDRHVYDSHMTLHNRVSRRDDVELLMRIREDLSNYPAPTTAEEFVSTNEAWLTANRLSKFIVNSLRVYEYFGHEWLIPLWDNELAEYWYGVPLADRVGSRRYDSFLFERVFGPMNVGFVKPSRLQDRSGSALIRRALPASFVRQLQGLWARARAGRAESDPNAFASLAHALADQMQHDGPRVRRHAIANEVLATYHVWHVSEDDNESTAESLGLDLE